MARDNATVATTYDEYGEYPATEKLFDVTCVIGSVYRDPGSDTNPVQTAFRMIADHDAEGQYSFPADGDFTYHVTVEHVPNKKED